MPGASSLGLLQGIVGTHLFVSLPPSSAGAPRGAQPTVTTTPPARRRPTLLIGARLVSFALDLGSEARQLVGLDQPYLVVVEQAIDALAELLIVDLGHR